MKKYKLCEVTNMRGIEAMNARRGIAMTKYVMYKKLSNGATMWAHTAYAHTAREAMEQALNIYTWNQWLTRENIIVRKA